MSRYPLRSRQTTSVIPATPGMDSSLSEMTENGAASALGSVTPPAASREPAAGSSELRDSSSSRATVEAGKISLPSEEPEGVGTHGIPARGASEDELSDENVLHSEIEDESDTSDATSTSEISASLSDSQEPRTAARPSKLRRTKSLDDLEIHAIHFANKNGKTKGLTKEQVRTVRAAEQSLTEEQREILLKCRSSLTKEKGQEHPPSPSPTPGPSSAISKGKFADCNQEISDGELDPEAQREALETWNQVRDINEEAESNLSDPEHEFQPVKRKHRKSQGKEDVDMEPKTKLQKRNRFEVLEVEETSDDDDSDEVEPTVKPRSNHKNKKPSSRKERKIRHVADEHSGATEEEEEVKPENLSRAEKEGEPEEAKTTP
ncbi:hypothetical protein IW262DRAFT_1298146 [Armillaria fumosa]|nr:hypothetical protein IW262DRAFT_1298146 [Armillaria fumosa]